MLQNCNKNDANISTLKDSTIKRLNVYIMIHILFDVYSIFTRGLEHHLSEFARIVLSCNCFVITLDSFACTTGYQHLVLMKIIRCLNFYLTYF